MILLGELLLVIGSALMIIVGFLIELKVGLTITSVVSIIWGLVILYIASKVPPKQNK